jgi:protein O-mannosyl-transferase
MADILQQSYYRLQFKKYWLLGAILIITILAYLPVLNAGFVNLDDNGYIYENPDIISGGVASIFHFFTHFYVGHYLPVTMLSFKIDHLIFGQNAHGYHFVNLLFHLLNCCLLFIFILKLFKNKMIAVIVAALFALHPIHVESVAWISERKDVLYVFFLLWASLFYVKHISVGSNRKYLLFSLFAFLLALLSKSAAVIFPFILILIDLITKRNFNKKLIWEKIPFFMLSVFFAILTLYSQDVGGKGSEVFARFTGFDKLIFIFYAFGFYIVKLFMPVNLSAFHPFPDPLNGILPDSFYLSIFTTIIFLSILIWLIYKSFKKKNMTLILFGMLFYFFTTILYLYLPVGRVVVAERFSYLSYTGLFLIFAIFINWLTTKSKSRVINRIILISVVLVTLCLSFLSYQRTLVWRNGVALWENVLSVYPTDPVANKSLADAFTGYKNYTLALDYYKKAIKYDPSYTEAYYNMGNMNLKNNNLFQAINDYSKALELNPKLADGYINRGNARAQLNDLSAAIDDYSQAIKYNPAKVEAYINRGSSWYLLKNQKNACSDWQLAANLGSVQANDMLSSYCR